MYYDHCLGSPITDFSTEGSTSTPQFYLVSIFKQPYRVIYTRYPYHYLKRFIRRYLGGKVSKTFRWYCVQFLPEDYRASSFSIQPIHSVVSNNRRINSLSRKRIREIVSILETHYVDFIVPPTF